MKHKEPDQWTPRLVGERLVEALRWRQYSEPRVGPASYRSGMPQVIMSDDERIETWGLPDWPSDDEEAARRNMRLRISVTPEKADAYAAALLWPIIYVAPTHASSARVLNLWCRCKVFRLDFAKEIDKRHSYHRSLAYRMRDRALSMIAVGLDRDGHRP